MDKSELARVPSAAKVDHEEKLIEESIKSYYCFISTSLVFL